MSESTEPVTVIPATPAKGFKIPPPPQAAAQRAFAFRFAGMAGCVDRFGFVTWAGIGFQREAAIGGLKQAIDDADLHNPVPQVRVVSAGGTIQFNGLVYQVSPDFFPGQMLSFLPLAEGNALRFLGVHERRPNTSASTAPLHIDRRTGRGKSNSRHSGNSTTASAASPNDRNHANDPHPSLPGGRKLVRTRGSAHAARTPEAVEIIFRPLPGHHS